MNFEDCYKCTQSRLEAMYKNTKRKRTMVKKALRQIEKYVKHVGSDTLREAHNFLRREKQISLDWAQTELFVPNPNLNAAEKQAAMFLFIQFATWQLNRVVYRFDRETTKRIVSEFGEFRGLALPFPGIYIEASLPLPENPREICDGFFFSAVKRAGELTGIMTIFFGNSKSVTHTSLKGVTVRPYIALVDAISERTLERRPSGDKKGFGSKKYKGEPQEWDVSYRKVADFRAKSAHSVTVHASAAETECEGSARPRKKQQVRACMQRFWVICPDDSNWKILEWRPKRAFIRNADAPGDLPTVERRFDG